MEALTKTEKKQLGQNIAKLRAGLDLTQEQLAEHSEIEPRFLQKIESGELGASLAVLKRIRGALNVDWNELLNGL